MYVMKTNFNKIGETLQNILTLFMEDPLMSPLVDDHVKVKQGEHSATYKLAIPGHSKEDVRLTKKGDKLLIYLKGDLKKSLFLTKSVDKDLIESSVKDGILTIDFTKAFESDEEELSID